MNFGMFLHYLDYFNFMEKKKVHYSQEENNVLTRLLHNL